MNKIDVSNISEDSKNVDDFICRICCFILQDPYECENCGTPYCKDCIEAWNQRSSFCPIKCGKTLRIKPAHRFIKKMLGELKVKCITQDCPEVFMLGTLDTHLNVCQFLSVKCTFEDCDTYVMRKELDKHMKECEHQEEICQTCSEKIKIKKSTQNLKEKQNEVKSDENMIKMCSERTDKHNCIKILSDRIKGLSCDNESLHKKCENYEKDITILKEKTDLLMCNIAYKCDLAHLLTFRANSSSTCSCCGLIKICTRWECETCKKMYCLDCIKLLNSKYCPNYHTFIFGNLGNFMCDTCGSKKTNGGPLSLHDPVCDLDLCEICVIKLFPNINK